MLLVAATLACAHAAEPAAQTANVWRNGVWSAPGREQFPIWPDGAPGTTGTAPATEKIMAVRKANGVAYTAIGDVSTPTLTVFPAKGSATGASVVVFPGGGFQLLAVDIEGTEICDWLTTRGIDCYLLKYRVPGSNHHYDKACRCHKTPAVLTSLQDAQRAIRLVRARAQANGKDPRKVGVMGFSAGGYLVAQTSNRFESAYAGVDATDALSSRPDFAVALYPGHLCRGGGTLDPDLHVSARTPPTFLLQAWDDPVDQICNSTVYARALDAAGVPAEVHLFAKGGHAFGVRPTPLPVGGWPQLVEHWLASIGMLPDAH